MKLITNPLLIDQYRQVFKNWFSIINSLRKTYKNSNYLTFSQPLFFKDGTEFVVKHPNSIKVAVGYCRVSYILNSFCSSDLKSLLEISDKISHLIDKVFDQSDFKLSFSQKEGILFALTRKFKPKTFVETGVAYGISTTVILEAMRLNNSGTLTSIDHPNKNRKGYSYKDGTVDPIFLPEGKEIGWAIPEYLKNRWSLMVGKSSDILPQIDHNVDIFYHDSEHSYENMMFELEWAYEHLSTNGIIGADDTNWNEAFQDFVQKRGMIKIFEKIADCFVRKPT